MSPRRTGRVLAPLALLLVLAAPVRAETAAPVLSCTGPLGPDASHAGLVAAYGAANVAWREVDGAEGEKIHASIVFPDDPKRRLELFWFDEKKRTGLASIRPARDNRVAAQNGLAPGLTLAQVEKLNGGPFSLSGFQWDYGGFVGDWQGGALSKPAAGGCLVTVRFTLPETTPDAVASAVAGDRTFSSTDPKMRAAKPIVDEIAFGYPAR